MKYKTGLIKLGIILALLAVISLSSANAFASSTLEEQYWASVAGGDGVYGAYWKGQTFTPQTGHLITSVDLDLKRWGNPTTPYTVGLYETSSGLPTEELDSNTLDPTTVSNSGAYVDVSVNLSGLIFLAQGDQYAIVLKTTGNDGNNFLTWGNPGVHEGYAGGQEVATNNSGSTWTVPNPGNSVPFEEWGEVVEPPSVTTEIASNVGSTTATISGDVTSQGTDTGNLVAWFQYGTSTSYGNSTGGQQVQGGDLGSYSEALTDLSQGEEYHYRAVVEWSQGYVYGSDETFTTLNPPNVETQEATNITISGAQLNGDLLAQGGDTGTLTASFQWGTTVGYGNTTSTQQIGSGSGPWPPYDVVLGTLNNNTTYHYRAKVVWSGGTVYGNDEDFNTYGGVPVVDTQGASQITNASAYLNGYISDTGGGESGYCVSYGYEWGTSSGTYPNHWTSDTGEYGIDEYPHQLTGLTIGQTYYFVFYATNSTTTYGDEESFAAIEAPGVTTNVASNIGAASAVLNGSIVSTGGVDESVYGFEWGISSGVYPSEWESMSGAYGAGSYTDTISDLTSGTTYYFVFFATNPAGTDYGVEQSFKVNAALPTTTPPPPGTYLAQANVTSGATSAGSILSNNGNPNLPSQMYTELNPNALPGEGIIADIFGVSGTPIALWWFPFIFLGIAILSLLVYEATTAGGKAEGSLLTMCVVIEVLLALFALIGSSTGNGGMIPFWPVFLFPIPATALILSRRHVGWG